MAWTGRARPQRAEGVLEGWVDGELVVLQPATGEYAGLDSTATRVWALIDQPTTVGELVATMAADYRVPRSECAPGIVACLEALRRQGLVSLRAD